MGWPREDEVNGFGGYSITPGSGAAGLSWPASGAIPESLSAGGWTVGNEGFVQQTFLGASIRSFNVNGGFGDSTSTLSVALVNDEYNVSDKSGRGKGDDVYHDGVKDLFIPPPVGSPVFFKFGKNPATVEDAWRKVFDDTYTWAPNWPDPGWNKPQTYTGSSRQTMPKEEEYPIVTTESGIISEIPDHAHYFKGSANPVDLKAGTGSLNIGDKRNKWENQSSRFDPLNQGRGRYHFAFGGILQSYTENRGGGGNPLYDVQVVDPREILSNAVLILNNYSGTTFNNENLFNVYGFLEYEPSDALRQALRSHYKVNDNPKLTGINPIDGQPPMLRKYVQPDGSILYYGDDMYRNVPALPFSFVPGMLPPTFPITGVGYSRRSDKGIPYYRVYQALSSLFNYDGEMPPEYISRGFGGTINFRGFNYVVDFSGIPLDKIPKFYYLDFDQIDMLSLAQELCDVISHDLFVSLLPVIDHPACEWLYNWNKDCISNNNPKGLVAGIIRVDAINRSDKPIYGSIQKFLSSLASLGIEVENRDIGFELSNIVTDKFIVGAQETEMYYFSGNKDRDFLEVRRSQAVGGRGADKHLKEQWYLSTSFNQQIIPFYGFLGKDAVTIPKGYGSYQQILLDSTSLNANGVGNYYIATEMELRAASVSFEQWKNFLLTYNDVYMESMEENDGFEKALLQQSVDIPDGQIFNPNISNNYGVSSPRCVWRSDRNYVGPDGLPASPCSPPYGYPLYFKRAEKIGLPEAGLAKITAAKVQIATNYAKLKLPKNSEKFQEIRMKDMEEAKDQIMVNLNSAKSVAAGIFDRVATLVPEAVFPKAMANFVTKNDKLRDVVTLAENLAAQAWEAAAKARAQEDYALTVGTIKNFLDKNEGMMKQVQRLQEEGMENALKVYNFVKGVADKHLGKTFLVKIPKRCNLSYSKDIKVSSITKGVWQHPDNFKLNAAGDQVAVNPEGVELTPSPEMISEGVNQAQSQGYQVTEYSYGPFGFMPRSINSDITDQTFGNRYGSAFQQNIMGLRNVEQGARISNGITDIKANHLSTNTLPMSDALPPYVHTIGALKCNYNPMSDGYEFNYTPDSQGGFFPFDLFENTLTPSDMAQIPNQSRIPLGTRQLLCPKDLTNFISENGRISCYVRFDDSQYLSFHGISKDSITQEVITRNGTLVPDLVAFMDNMKPDEFHSFNTKDDLSKLPRSLAFVKCEVDSNLYMAPKSVGVDGTATFALTGSQIYKDRVFGRDVVDIGQISEPRQIWNESGCYWENSYQYYEANFVPNPKNGGYDGTKVRQEDFYREYNAVLDGDIIRTDIAGLDPNHVYALITLPGKVNPTKDSRMKDGPYFKYQPALLKHFLTMDTVKGVYGFEKPTFKGKPTNHLVAECDSFSVENIINAKNAQKKALAKMTLATPEAMLSVAVPSPVYPDLVALPLMSKDRCYGPWISSSVDIQAFRHRGIGGKIEFVKDENIAPWNYAGYQLMNEAGKLQAIFSNSMLLFSERGGFVYPDAPRGNTLAQSLIDGGPLVTSISVDVSEGGVKTTYKMDLYTANFGKLVKQKEILIGKVARERQRLRDQRNQLIRKGVGKAQSSVNLGAINRQFDHVLLAAKASENLMTSLDKSHTHSDMMVASVVSDNHVGHNHLGESNSTKRVGYEVSSQPRKILNQAISIAPDKETARRLDMNTFGGSWSSMMGGVSQDVYHPDAPYFQSINYAANQERYYFEGGELTQNLMPAAGTGGGTTGGTTAGAGTGGSTGGTTDGESYNPDLGGGGEADTGGGTGGDGGFDSGGGGGDGLGGS